jgi:hypothetical protein
VRRGTGPAWIQAASRLGSCGRRRRLLARADIAAQEGSGPTGPGSRATRTVGNLKSSRRPEQARRAGSLGWPVVRQWVPPRGSSGSESSRRAVTRIESDLLVEALNVAYREASLTTVDRTGLRI